MILLRKKYRSKNLTDEYYVLEKQFLQGGKEFYKLLGNKGIYNADLFEKHDTMMNNAELTCLSTPKEGEDLEIFYKIPGKRRKKSIIRDVFKVISVVENKLFIVLARRSTVAIVKKVRR